MGEGAFVLLLLLAAASALPAARDIILGKDLAGIAFSVAAATLVKFHDIICPFVRL